MILGIYKFFLIFTLLQLNSFPPSRCLNTEATSKNESIKINQQTQYSACCKKIKTQIQNKNGKKSFCNLRNNMYKTIKRQYTKNETSKTSTAIIKTVTSQWPKMFSNLKCTSRQFIDVITNGGRFPIVLSGSRIDRSRKPHFVIFENKSTQLFFRLVFGFETPKPSKINIFLYMERVMEV